MTTNLAAIVVGLLVVASPVVAQQTSFAKLFARAGAVEIAANAAHSKGPRVAKKTRPTAARGATAAPVDRAGKTKSRKPARRAAGVDTASVLKAYAVRPQAERLAIQSDLAWAADYQGAPGGDFDQHAIDAVKLFQKRNGEKETGILNDQQRALLAAVARLPMEAVGWRLIDDPATGARFGVPEKLVSARGISQTGGRWFSGHHQIQIETFRLREAGLPALFKEEQRAPRGRRVRSGVLKPDSFVIIGTQGLKNFVAVAQKSGDQVRGITILYDQATAGIMGPAAIAISNTFEAFPNANASASRRLWRATEYSTAIAANGSGDLVVSRQATSACDFITVPGFGHAERVAADKTDDLALIRLYGARNLVPAAFGGKDEKAGDLTLVGVADPLLEDGRDAVSKAAARLDGESIEPTPTPGFAGAAAIDAQGGFAGMVDLESLPVSDTGIAALQATLVPARAVRAFLIAHGILPATGSRAIEHSVMQVICVRK